VLYGDILMKTKYDIFILILISFSIPAESGNAQELSPRAYWPAPKGTMVAFLGYQHSFGDVLTDPSLPLTGLDSRIHAVVLGYLQTFSLFNRTTSLIIELPYTWVTTNGIIESSSGGTPSRRDISGIADIGITFSINLLGAPTMGVKEFQDLRNNPQQILGASLKILAPTGAYEEDKLINISSNRWAFKPELGYMIPLTQKWLLELGFGMWIFSDNNEFLGKTRKQNPIFATQLHLVRRFNPGFWATIDLNFFGGGRTNLVEQDLQRNSRVGFTIVYPLAGRHALKGGFSMGVVTESGNDFKSFILGYSVLLN
jgi:hypothetical protein